MEMSQLVMEMFLLVRIMNHPDSGKRGSWCGYVLGEKTGELNGN